MTGTDQTAPTTDYPFSVYVHVPFCARKCPYCDFNTYATPEPPLAAYFKAVTSELRAYASRPEWLGRPLRSIFFGGGTPSLVPPEMLGRFLTELAATFEVTPEIEVTLEANPDDASVERLTGFRAAGINRVSFGVQSFSSRTLTMLGRLHGREQGFAAIENARRAGFENVSIDLIFGAPGQSREELREDLREAAGASTDHLSAYSLTIEPGTPFYQSAGRGLLALPEEEEVRGMLIDDLALLEKEGFTRYEVSNFSRPGKESTHNLGYWVGIDYLGLGAGAHGFVQSRNSGVVSALRWGNQARPETYIRSLESGEFPISWSEQVDASSRMVEFMMLGLRVSRGVSLERFDELFGISLEEAFPGTSEQLIGEGLLAKTAESLHVTEAGLPLLDSITGLYTTPVTPSGPNGSK